MRTERPKKKPPLDRDIASILHLSCHCNPAMTWAFSIDAENNATTVATLYLCHGIQKGTEKMG